MAPTFTNYYSYPDYIIIAIQTFTNKHLHNNHLHIPKLGVIWIKLERGLAQSVSLPSGGGAGGSGQRNKVIQWTFLCLFSKFSFDGGFECFPLQKRFLRGALWINLAEGWEKIMDNTHKERKLLWDWPFLQLVTFQ